MRSNRKYMLTDGKITSYSPASTLKSSIPRDHGTVLDTVFSVNTANGFE